MHYVKSEKARTTIVIDSPDSLTGVGGVVLPLGGDRTFPTVGPFCANAEATKIKQRTKTFIMFGNK